MAFDVVTESNPDILPIETARQVISEMAEQSVALGLSRRLRLSTRQQRIPVTTQLAQAYWVGGSDSTAHKQTDRNDWKGVYLTAEELAVLVPIPNAFLDDSGFPVWEETRPSVVEAMGTALDAAVLFGVNKPSTFPGPIYQTAHLSGNTTLSGLGVDLAQSIAFAARDLRREEGYRTTAFANQPGFQWELVGLRSTDGHPIYQQNLSGPISTGLYGFPLMEAGNGAWDSDEAVLILGDWSKSIVGVREDITFTRHTDGIITDAGGAVQFNAMQQDSTIFRAVFRVGWATANPQTRINQAASGVVTSGSQPYPFWVLLNQGSYSYS